MKKYPVIATAVMLLAQITLSNSGIDYLPREETISFPLWDFECADHGLWPWGRSATSGENRPSVFSRAMPAQASPRPLAVVVDWVRTNMSLLPEASFDSDYRTFAFHKNAYFREKYRNETNMNIDLAFLSVKQRFYWMFRGEVRGGFGASPSGLILHPYDVSFSLNPTLEYRFRQLHLAAGLDHRCFHLIDQEKPPMGTVYWNKFVISLNSPQRRVHPYVEEFIGDSSWNGFGRLLWSFSWGYYITKFFGMVHPVKIMSQRRPHYLHDFNLIARYGLLRWKRGAATITEASTLGIKYNDEGIYWAQEMGAEILFALRPFDASFFVNYILDKGRFNGKDRLMELGIRVAK